MGLLMINHHEKKYKNLPNPLSICIQLSYITSILSYILIVCNSVFGFGGSYKKIFLKFSMIIRNLNADDQYSFHQYKKWLIFIHSILFLNTLLYFSFRIYKWEAFSAILSSVVMFTTDLEILHFIIEVDLVSKLLNLLNQNLIKMNNKFKCTNLAPFVVKNQKNIYTVGQNEEDVVNYLLLFHQLADIIDEINSCYAVLVSVQNK